MSSRQRDQQHIRDWLWGGFLKKKVRIPSVNKKLVGVLWFWLWCNIITVVMENCVCGEKMKICMPACSCSYRLYDLIALVNRFFLVEPYILLDWWLTKWAQLICSASHAHGCAALWNAPCLGTAMQMSPTPLSLFMGGAELQRASSCAAAPSSLQPAATAPPALALTLQSCWDLEHFWERHLREELLVSTSAFSPFAYK